jgi:hypothetical protein
VCGVTILFCFLHVAKGEPVSRRLLSTMKKKKDKPSLIETRKPLDMALHGSDGQEHDPGDDPYGQKNGDHHAQKPQEKVGVEPVGDDHPAIVGVPYRARPREEPGSDGGGARDGVLRHVRARFVNGGERGTKEGEDGDFDGEDDAVEDDGGNEGGGACALGGCDIGHGWGGI